MDDKIILSILSIGVGIFALVHLILFRALPTHKIFQGIMVNVALGAMALIVFVVMIYFKEQDISIFLSGFLALVIYLAIVFVYVLCVLGPFETSIRMRLIRELGISPDGLTAQELDEAYNTSIMLQIRLNRLQGAGYIVLVDGKYKLLKKQNMFFIIDTVANCLKRYIK